MLGFIMEVLYINTSIINITYMLKYAYLLIIH